jgi:carotenoid 1,2-hydratase
VLYGTGGQKRWAMTERRPRHALNREARRLRIGPSHMRWTGRALVIDIDEVATPLPRRVRGRVTVHPAGLSPFVAQLDSRGAHRWGPIAPCARVEVEMAEPSLSWKGHAYIDSNEGDEPVDRGFTEWDWQRATLAEGSTAVVYDVRQTGGRGDRVIATRFQPDGSAQAFEPPPRQVLPASRWRIRRHMRSDAPATRCHTLEDTPFYARSVVPATLLGEPGAGHARNVGHRPAGVARCPDAAALSHAEATLMSTSKRLSIFPPRVSAARPSSAGRCVPGNLAAPACRFCTFNSDLEGGAHDR